MDELLAGAHDFQDLDAGRLTNYEECNDAEEKQVRPLDAAIDIKFFSLKVRHKAESKCIEVFLLDEALVSLFSLFRMQLGVVEFQKAVKDQYADIANSDEEKNHQLSDNHCCELVGANILPHEVQLVVLATDSTVDALG